MQLQRLTDEEAVSPVIGVILMVAITVILAAVIGTFVLGLGDRVQTTPPSASFSFDFDSGAAPGSADCGSTGDGVLTITHDGGPGIVADRLTVKGSSDGPHEFTCDYGANSEISAGDSLAVSAARDDTVRVVWASANGDDTATLGEWSGPDA